MGKGGGCMPSKSKAPLGAPEAVPNKPKTTQSEAPSHSADATPPAVVAREVSDEPKKRKKLRLFVVFYSMYGHVESLARKMKQGIDGVDGVEGVLYRVAETLPPEVLELMKVPPKDDEIPVISGQTLVEADGILFGFPTRFGALPAQMKALFDSTGGLWQEQKLAGKPAGFFVSTGTQGGGQETTAWTAITQLAHHGMLYVPVGYTFGAEMFKMDDIRGGSPYGAGVYAGDGTRQPTERELAFAEHQGKYMALVVKKLAK